MAYNTILLKGENPNIEELVANAAITPGMLVELMSSGLVRAHSTASGGAAKMFALEDSLQGKDITDAYAATDRVQVWHPQMGDQVYALLADGEDVSIGDFLVSNGDGYLKKYSFDSAEREELIVAKAKENVDRSSSSGGDTNVTGRIVVEVMG